MLTLHWKHIARKCLPYIVEPRTEGPTSWWEGFCTTNPTALRLPGDDRVFLGYRAAGTATSYYDGFNMVWGSALGLAILNASGDEVLHRFPLPIVYRAPDHRLPQNRAEYDAYIAEHGQHECLLHDFRLWLNGDRLYLVYHSAGLNRCLDCVAWMSVADFRQRVETSLELLKTVRLPEHEAWGRIWWGADAWTPAGVDGTPYIYASLVNKNDIVFFKRDDGSLRMSHRPYPDMAMLETGHDLHAVATADGITRYGSIERCIRPGFFDNAHIGANGAPTPAMIGDVPVYIEITHGVHDQALTKDHKDDNWDLIYMPYLRVSDRATGAELYYSDAPILDYDGVWRDYVEEGAWVKRLTHLQGVIFPGGQLPLETGKINVDDTFMFFTGVGDTAVARALFTLRELVPASVLEDIMQRPSHAAMPIALPELIQPVPGHASGWQWELSHAPKQRAATIVRRLGSNGQQETATALVLPRPGYFDADGLCWLEGGLHLIEHFGWVAFYHGVRWVETTGQRQTIGGIGVVLLDPENLERVLYRTSQPLPGSERHADGRTSPDPQTPPPARYHSDPLAAVPEPVREEWLRIQDLIARSRRDGSHHTRWLLQKSAKAAELLAC